MQPLELRMMGGFGNQCLQWLHAKKRAELEDRDLFTPAWPGEEVFMIEGKRPDGQPAEPVRGYFQRQQDINYSIADVRRWFRFRPKMLAFEATAPKRFAHIRRGDYLNSEYPIIAESAVREAIFHAGYHPSTFIILTDGPVSWHHKSELDFVADFVKMATSDILFRANSTFSFVAGMLCRGKVYAPIVDKLKGGAENDPVKYVEGNWPKCSTYSTDLHIPNT